MEFGYPTHLYRAQAAEELAGPELERPPTGAPGAVAPWPPDRESAAPNPRGLWRAPVAECRPPWLFAARGLERAPSAQLPPAVEARARRYRPPLRPSHSHSLAAPAAEPKSARLPSPQERQVRADSRETTRQGAPRPDRNSPSCQPPLRLITMCDACGPPVPAESKPFA